jgi:hypothetical protein
MKTWQEKFNSDKLAITKNIDKAFADMPAGAPMHISTPQAVDAYVHEIPVGTIVSSKSVREGLAKLNHAEYTCPVTTGIFLRIAAEVAFEEYQSGKNIGEICPFWRVVEPKSPLAKKLKCGPDFIIEQRINERIKN